MSTWLRFLKSILTIRFPAVGVVLLLAMMLGNARIVAAANSRMAPKSAPALPPVFWLRPEKITYDVAGYAVCELTLMRGAEPVRLQPSQWIGGQVSYRTARRDRGTRGFNKWLDYWEELRPTQAQGKEAFTTFQARAPEYTFCTANIVLQEGGITYSAQTHLTLFGKAWDISPRESTGLTAPPLPSGQYPEFTFTGSQRPYYVVTGKPLSFQYAVHAPTHTPTEAHVWVNGRSLSQALTTNAQGRFTYTPKAVPPLSSASDRKPQHTLFVVKAAGADGDYVSSLHLDIQTPHYTYANPTHGWLLLLGGCICCAWCILRYWRRPEF